MAIIIISVVVLLPVIILLLIGNKVRNKFTFDKEPNEEVIEVNDAVKFIKKNNQTIYTDGIMYLTNSRLLFFKHKFDWLNVIPIIGEAISSIFIDKNIALQLPLHQLKHFTFQPKITYHNHRVAEQKGLTTFYTKQNEVFEFDIYVLGLAEGKAPDILLKLEKKMKELDNPNANNIK